MSTLFKWLAGLVVGVVALVVLSAVLLPVILNPDDYREQLRSLAMDTTGYELHLNGTMDWSIFPHLGLSVTDIQIDDIHNKPLATLNRADIHIALIPLIFQQRVDMQALVFEGLTLNLERDRQGTPNWLEPQQSEDTVPPSSQTDTPQQTKASKSLTLNIASIDVSQININYRDMRTDQSLAIRNARLQTGAIRAGQPFDLTSGFTIENSAPPQAVTITLETELTLDLKKNVFEARDLNLTLTPEGSKNPETLTMLANILAENAQLDGDIAIKTVNLRRLMQQLGIPLPEISSQNALTNVSLTTTVSAAKNKLALHDMKLALDDFSLNGKISVTDINNRTLRFTLMGNDLLLDNYLPVATTEKPDIVQEQPATPTTETKNTIAPPMIPVDLLKTLNLEGKLTLSGLTAKNFHFDKPTLALKADDGLITLSKLNAGFYNGVIDSQASIDVNGIPQLSTRSTLQNIDLQALAEAVPDLQSVTGKANANVRLLTTGLTEPELLKHLNGVVEFHVDNGTLHGINLNKTVCSGIANIRKKDITKDNWPDETLFNSLKGTFNISEGMASNNNLSASMSQLNLCGSGTINLVKQSLDYQLGITVTGSTAEEDEPACRINEKYADLTWPVHCSGKIGDSDLCGIDEQRLGKLAATVAERELKGKLQQKLDDKLRKKFGDQLGEELGDKLNNLFQ